MRIEGLGVDIPQNIEFKKISTDTRTIEQGDFYIPLKGANFDGEKFIQQAVDKGAIGYLTTGETNIPNAIGKPRLKSSMPFIRFIPNKLAISVGNIRIMEVPAKLQQKSLSIL